MMGQKLNNKDVANLTQKITANVLYNKFKAMRNLILLHDDNVIYKEMIVNKHRCMVAILIWLYVPDFTYKNKDFLITDAQLLFFTTLKYKI